MTDIDTYLTRSIVGRPQKLLLGVPTVAITEPTIAIGVAPPAARRWIEADTLVAFATAGMEELKRQWRAAARPAAWAAGGALVAGAIAYVATATSASVTPDAAPVTGPIAVESAKTAEQPLPFLPAGMPASSREAILPPTVALSLESGTYQAAAVPPRLPPSPVTSKPTSAPPKPTTEPEKPMLILDAAQRGQQAAPAPTPAAANGQPVKAAAAVPPPATAAPSTTPAPRTLASPSSDMPAARAVPREEAKINLVAVDKANNFALITNPQTRLPQRFEVGQTVFTGETIRKIDGAAGRIHLDSRVVTMQ